MAISTTPYTVILALPDSKASVEVAFLGATVVSWKVPTHGSTEERLFVSSKSGVTGPKAIRGGIPVCWPIFGPPPKPEEDTEGLFQKLSQHGFARTSIWKLDDAKSSAEEGRLVFNLETNDASRAVFARAFSLTYIVTLSKDTLTTALHVSNPSTATTNLKFQALLHTYIAVPSPFDTTVEFTPSTKGLELYDKAAGGVIKTEDREKVTFEPEVEVDRVYRNIPGAEVLVRWDKVGVISSGLRITKVGLSDVTVWNPSTKVGSAIGDMEMHGWLHYICVEPGQVSKWVELSPGQSWDGSQKLEALFD